MTRITRYVSFCFLVVCTAAVSAFALVPAEIELSNETPEQLVSLHMGEVLTFQYLYEPDPFPENPDILGIPAHFTVTNAAGGFREFGDIFAYYPNTGWHSAVLEFPADLIVPTENDILFSMPIEFTSSFEYLETIPNRPLDNKFFIRDIESFPNIFEFESQENAGVPVPEPGTFAMMGTALLGMLGITIRKRRS